MRPSAQRHTSRPAESTTTKSYAWPEGKFTSTLFGVLLTTRKLKRTSSPSTATSNVGTRDSGPLLSVFSTAFGVRTPPPIEARVMRPSDLAARSTATLERDCGLQAYASVPTKT